MAGLEITEWWVRAHSRPSHNLPMGGIGDTDPNEITGCFVPGRVIGVFQITPREIVD